MEVDWSMYEQFGDDAAPVRLGEAPMNEEVSVKFTEIIQTEAGSLLARVETELEGDHIWLHSSEYGNQNGFPSLLKASGGGGNIEGKTFTFTRLESEKSPAGYAFRWMVP